MIYWFNKIVKEHLMDVGNKGLRVSQLYNAGLPVPLGFVIPASYFDSFLEPLKPFIKQKLESVDFENFGDLKTVCEEIQKKIMNSSLEFREELQDSYEALDTGKDLTAISHPYIVVRSSPVADDERVFAAHQAYFQNVKGLDNLITAVKAAYASLWVAKLTYYRHKNNFDHFATKLPLVIQLFVLADSSGMGYSVNPSNKALEIVLEAVYGLGQALLLTNPDVYIVNKETLEIKEHNINKKTLNFVKDKESDKIISKDIPESQQENQVLDDKQIRECSRLVKKTEKSFNYPQKVEWCFKGQDCSVLGSKDMKI